MVSCTYCSIYSVRAEAMVSCTYCSITVQEQKLWLAAHTVVLQCKSRGYVSCTYSGIYSVGAEAMVSCTYCSITV